jgi:hypothetical protein
MEDEQTPTPVTNADPPVDEAPVKLSKAQQAAADQMLADDAAAELARHHTREELVELAATAERGRFIEDDPAQIYTVGIWGREGEGQPNYGCRLCSFAVTGTRGPLLVTQHYKAQHAPAEEEHMPSGLVGPNGQPL